MTRWRAILTALSFVALPALADVPGSLPQIAIIIDDLGYGLAAGERALELPGAVSFAVLPATPRGKTLAEKAYASGKEVLLHLPLQSATPQETEEPGSLLLDMTRGQFAAMFAEDFNSVPHAVGVNSHRGSLLTRHPGHMAWLMEEIQLRGGLFFVDSYTTHESIALKMAHEASPKVTLGVGGTYQEGEYDSDSLTTRGRQALASAGFANDGDYTSIRLHGEVALKLNDKTSFSVTQSFEDVDTDITTAFERNATRLSLSKRF